MAYEYIWYLISEAGSPQGWVLATAIMLFAYLIIKDDIQPGHKKTFRRFLFIIIPALAATLLITQSLKHSINIERICTPCTPETAACNPYCPTDSSFPSGHSATAFVAFSSFFLLKPSKTRLLVFIIPSIVSAARVAIGVHTIADVISGALIGVAVTALVSYLKTGKNPSS